MSTSTDLIKSEWTFLEVRATKIPMVHISTIQLRDKVEQKVSITRLQKRGWAHG